MIGSAFLNRDIQPTWGGLGYVLGTVRLLSNSRQHINLLTLSASTGPARVSSLQDTL
jgi:hypothetical protein